MPPRSPEKYLNRLIQATRLHGEKAKRDIRKNFVWSQLRCFGKVLLRVGELPLHRPHHASLQVKPLRIRQVGQAKVGDFETQVIVIVIERNLAEVNVAILILRIEVRRKPEGVICLSGLAVLQVSGGSNAGELGSLMTLVQEFASVAATAY